MTSPIISRRLVVVESPYAGNIDLNVRYARACLADCIRRGEAPIASHLLYTQPNVLDDNIPEQRQLGINCGLAWYVAASAVAFYIDLGWSKGMIAAADYAAIYAQSWPLFEIEQRFLPPDELEKVRNQT